MATIEQTYVDQAIALRNAGDISGAWQALADGGDVYAKEATKITADDPSLLGEVVQIFWDLEVTQAVRLEKWEPVANTHLGNYLDRTTNPTFNSGNPQGIFTLPDTEFIETSYVSALTVNGLSANLAIDLSLNQLTQPLTIPLDDYINKYNPGEPIDGYDVTIDLPDWHNVLAFIHGDMADRAVENSQNQSSQSDALALGRVGIAFVAGGLDYIDDGLIGEIPQAIINTVQRAQDTTLSEVVDDYAWALSQVFDPIFDAAVDTFVPDWAAEVPEIGSDFFKSIIQIGLIDQIGGVTEFTQQNSVVFVENALAWAGNTVSSLDFSQGLTEFAGGFVDWENSYAGEVPDFQFNTWNLFESATGVDLDYVFGLRENAGWQSSVLNIGNANNWLITPEASTLWTSSGAQGGDYLALQYGSVVFTNTTDHVTTPASNLYMNFETDFSKGVYDYSNDHSALDFGSGLFLGGGNYFGTMDASILNGDGWRNVIQSGTGADSFRPGNFELGADNFFNFQLDNSIYQGLYGSRNFTDSVVFTQNNYLGGLSKFTGNYLDSFSLLNIDPLVLDMDGDGIELVSFDDSTATFDVDNDGYIENTGWVSADDALLVHDLNADGEINDITETISEYYAAAPGTGALYEDGLQALATLDSNRDGVFDSNDNAYANLRVWEDANEDAKTDAGELKTLAELNITEIDLTREIVSREEIEGNPILARSTMTRSGIEYVVASVDFATNALGYEWNDVLEGIHIQTEDGMAASLYLDDSADQVIDLNVLNNDADPDNDVDAVIGNDGDDTITGDDGDNWLMGGLGSDTLSGGAGDDLLVIDAEDDLVNIDGGEGFDVLKVTGGAGVVVNMADINVETVLGGDGNDIIQSGGNTNAFIRGGAGDDVIIGGSADDALSGEDGDDTLDGGLGNDILRGHRGDDVLIGDVGEDYLEGGLGDDKLHGGDGEDLLRGDEGNDTLYGGSNYDVAEFRGKLDEYDVNVLADGSVEVRDKIAGRDGNDILIDIEALNFSNIKEVPLDLENPFTANDVISVTGSGPYIIYGADILANDQDYQGDDIFISDVTDVVGGTATLLGDGNIEFTPDASYQGVMSFKYTIEDSEGNSGAYAINKATGQSAEIKGTVYLEQDHHPDDPLFYEQWYINDANILPVWNDYTGKGVSVGVFEIGVPTLDHPDLVDNLSQDTIDHSNPDFIDGHATLVSGVIAASKNDQGSIGVAYDATLSAKAFGSEDNPDLNVMFEYKNYDIVNNSWGPEAQFVYNFTDNPQNELPFYDAVTQGRGGLGTVIVFAAGNDRLDGDNADAYNFYNNKYTISVGAINKNADLSSLEIQQDPFSNPGSNILISAPGSNITSTALLLENSNGSMFGADFDTAEGTSFATPLVSGIAALMLEANPELGYRDVMEILAYSARTVNDQNTVWQTNGASTWNGGGLHFSHDYGFGNVDALAAVRLAETWDKQQINDNLSLLTIAGNLLNEAIPDNGAAVTDTVNVNIGSDKFTVEHATVTIDFTHDRLGDLVFKLISPNGTEGVLLKQLDVDPGSSSDPGYGAIDLEFDFGNVSAWGESAIGDWTLSVQDLKSGQTGIIRNWSLELSGKYNDLDDNYIYTEEFSTLSDVSRLTLSDVSGEDAINTSAIASSVTIDLNENANSTIDGKTVLIATGTVIEKAFAGDGDDTLTGNAQNNLLYGGRGNDSLLGGAGNDWLVGAQGDDSLTGGLGIDRYIIRNGDAGTKTIEDFDLGNDIITVANYSDVEAFSDLTITAAGNDSQIILSDGQTILVKNTIPSALTQNHFEFNQNFHLNSILLDVHEESLTENADVFNADSQESTPQRIFGLGGNDTIRGGLGDDELYGGGGDDTINGYLDSENIAGGKDKLFGEAGNDLLYGSGEQDYLYGGTGDDQLFGNNGDDYLYGGEGSDVLIGGQGDDEIHISDGLNNVWGDEYDADPAQYDGTVGNDTFIVHEWEGPVSGGVLGIGIIKDLIRDFDVNNEVIDISNVQGALSFEDLNLTTLNINGDIYARVGFGDNGQTISLYGITPGELSAANFIFYENKLPDAMSDVFSVAEDASIVFSQADLLSNDTDLEDGTVLFSKLIEFPQHGTLADDGNGNYTYTPFENYYGNDYLTYEVADTDGGTSTSIVSINVNAVNDAPAAVDDIFIVPENRDFTGNVLNGQGNDTDIDGDILSVVSGTFATSQGGVVTVSSNGEFTYTPATDFTGADSFDYTLSDGNGGSDIGSVSLEVFNIQSVQSINEDTPITLDLLSGYPAGYSISGVHHTEHGSVVINPDQTVTYTPHGNYYGEDSFAYEITDTNSNLIIDGVFFNIAAINDAPVLVKNTISFNEDIETTVTSNMLKVLDVESAADQIIYTLSSLPENGALKLDNIDLSANGQFTQQDVNEGKLTFTPVKNYNGADSFSYTVTDGVEAQSASANITIYAVDDILSGNSHGLLYVPLGDGSIVADGSFNASITDALPTLINGNTSAIGTLSHSSAYAGTREGWYALDGTINTPWSNATSESTAWLSFDFTDAKVINKYMVASRGDQDGGTTSPQAWTFAGSNDGSNWITLDTVSGETDWSQGEARYYDFVNGTAYDQYRITFTQGNGGPFYTIGEIDFIEAQVGPSGQVLFEGMSLSDMGGTQINGVELRLSGHQDGIDHEILSASETAGITSSYQEDVSTGDYVLSLSGVASVSEYQSVLDSITYINDAQSKTDGLRHIDVTITDASSNESQYEVDILVGDDASAQQLSELDYIALPSGETTGINPDGSLNTSIIDSLPVMTNSGATPEGVLTRSSAYAASREGWYALDGTINTPWSNSISESTAWLSFDFTESKIINKYMVASRGDQDGGTTSPQAWTFAGSNDGSNWITLDTVSGETGWSQGEARYYDFVNGTAYDEYRITFTQNGGGSFYTVGEVDFIEAIETVQFEELQVLSDIYLSPTVDDLISAAQVRLAKDIYTLSEEVLAVLGQGNVTANYSEVGDYYVLALNGADSTATYESVLQSLTYKNTTENLSGNRVLEIFTFDSSGNIEQSFTQTLDLYAQEVVGTAGNDILSVSVGDQILSGGLGDDEYVYRLGSGVDVINDTGGNDVLRFESGFNAANIIQTQVGNDLEITFTNSEDDKVVIRDHYLSVNHEIENFVYGVDLIPGSSHSVLYAEGNGSYVEDGSLNTSIIDALPVMTNSGATPEGVLTRSSAYAASREGWYALDGTINTPWSNSTSESTAWLSFDFTDAKVINKYMVASRGDQDGATTSPQAWTFAGSNDGSNWITLDTVSGETGWSQGDSRYYDFVNGTAYDQYRITFTQGNGGPFYTIGEIDFIEAQVGPSGQQLFEGITLNDVGSVQISEMEIRLSGHQDGIANEILSATVSAGVTSSYQEDVSTGDYVLLLSGVASVSDYQSVLDSVTYINEATNKTDGMRHIDVTITDNSNNDSQYGIDVLVGSDASAQTLTNINYIALPVGASAGVDPDGALNTSIIDALPVMTNSGATPEGVLTRSTAYNSAREGWHALDGTIGSPWSNATSESTAWLSFNFTDAKVINKYMVASRGDQDGATTSPQAWTFAGSNDGSNWITLDTVSGETGWSQGESRYYDFVNGTAYDQYRITFTQGNGGPFYTIGEIDFIEAVVSSQVDDLQVLLDVTLTAPADDIITEAFIRLEKDIYTIAEEVLSVIDQGNITSTYEEQSDYFVLHLTGSDSTATYESVLQSLSYQNLGSDIGGNRTLEILTFDSAGNIDQSFALTLDLYTQEFEGTSGDDTLNGTAGNDILYGLDGLDTLIGGDGADIFAVKSDGAFNNVDQISDFNLSEDDKLDVSDLLFGYDPLSDSITDFVQITDNGTDSFLAVDADGGADNFVQVLTIQNHTGLDDEAGLQTNGNLIV